MTERVPYRIGDNTVMVTPADKIALDNDTYFFGNSFIACNSDGTAKRIAPSDVSIKRHKE